jgi:NAD(P)-dependent dehydrogenase (short-subunit alcohol dehydrogenase family)
MDDLFSLKGKNIVITGASGILGQHFCRALANAGGNLAMVDVNEEILRDQVANLQKDFNVKIVGYVGDVSSEISVDKTINQIIKDFGVINVLHNNAASKSSNLDEFFASYEDYSLNEWRKIMSVNIDGMFLMSKFVGRHMVERGVKGSIIQTASIYGLVAPDQRIYEGSFYLNRPINTPAVYSASKAAVIGLTKYLSTYWGEKGIRVNTLTPGGMESGQNDIFKQKYSNRVPLGRMGEPNELVGALIYLASDASSYVTGQNIVVDGGLSAW